MKCSSMAIVLMRDCLPGVPGGSMFLLLLFLGERRDHALALDLDLLGEAGVALLDEAGGEADLEQRHRKDGGEVIEIRTRRGELHRLARFITKLLQRLGDFLVE